MKIQYEGEKVKTIPKKYSAIKNVSKYFMSNSKRLTKEEREVLEEKLNRQVLDGLVETLRKGLSKAESEYLGKHSLLSQVNKILRWKQSSYFEAQFVGKNSSNIGIVCTEKFYTIAKKLKGIKTAEIKRSY